MAGDGAGRPTPIGRPTSTPSAPTWPRCSAARPSCSTPAGPTSSSAATPAAGGPPGRTSPTCATDGSFTEYGSLAIAAQRGRRSVEELIERTPADGLVAGVGRVNGRPVRRAVESSCAVLSYDYTVLAGTQGQQNHRKKDRVFELVERLRLPVVLFAEGGGGRPGDTDYAVITGLDTTAFARFGALSGLVPMVGVVSGWCFAGNAALLGCCDVIIATTGTSIGMGGPAMIEGGGLGTYRPEEIGPLDVQTANGVVDLVAEDDADAVRLAKQYLAYFQGGERPTGPVPTSGSCAACVPENRLRAYDIADLIAILADTGSVLELRSGFGPGMVTALVRIEGRAVGVVANDPGHLGGAIDSDGADKAARFLQLCDAHDLPILFLCDTPGFMVGPEAEQTRPGPALQPALRDRGQPHRALLHHRPAQGVRARRPGHGRRELPVPGLHGGLADRRARRHGARGGGAARLPPRAGGRRGPRPSGRPSSSTWSIGPTSTARRSTWPPRSRSTT